MKLSRGEIRQNKSQTVLEYGTQFRNAAMTAYQDLPAIVLCDKFVSGLFHPDMRRECATPLLGG
eukprot:48918-Pelagomonas_calceolata.AAC.1